MKTVIYKDEYGKIIYHKTNNVNNFLVELSKRGIINHNKYGFNGNFKIMQED